MKGQKVLLSIVILIIAAIFILYSYPISFHCDVTYLKTNGSTFSVLNSICFNRFTAAIFPNSTSLFINPPRIMIKRNNTQSRYTSQSNILIQPWDKCELDKISEGRQKSDGRWFNFSSTNFSFYTYSAFIDNRESLFSTTPILRIIGVTNIALSKVAHRSMYAANFSCVLYFNTSTRGKFTQTIRTVKATAQNSAHARASSEQRGYVKGKNHWEFVFGCPLEYKDSVTVWPQAVAITAIGAPKPDNCMPVEVPVTMHPKKDFVVCVAVTFGKVNPWRLVQWFEIQRIVGVSKIYMYDYGIKADVLKVVEYYEDQGILELYTMTRFSGGGEHYWVHHRQAINDCMYRNINQFNYMVVIDVDEFILPVQQRNLLDLVKYLDKAESAKKSRPVTPSFYEFLNGYYFMNKVHDNTTLLTYLRHRRVNVMPISHAIKCITNLQACLAMHSHRCVATTPSHRGPSYIRVLVNASIGTNRHYKGCHFNYYKQCVGMLKSGKQNDEILPNAEALKQAAIPAFQKIFNKLPIPRA